MRYFAVIFDFDYTLADATPGIAACANHALTCLGYPARDVETIRKTVGLTLEETFSALTGLSDRDSAKRFRECFTEKADLIMTDSTALLPDTVPFLERLKTCGVKTGIFTNKNHYRIDEALRKYAIAHLIDCIVGFEDVVAKKPLPEGLLKAIGRLGAEKSRVLYVGDSLTDAKAAHAAGVDFAAVTTGTTEAHEFEAYPHVAVAESLTRLWEMMQ